MNKSEMIRLLGENEVLLLRDAAKHLEAACRFIANTEQYLPPGTDYTADITTRGHFLRNDWLPTAAKLEELADKIEIVLEESEDIENE